MATPKWFDATTYLNNKLDQMHEMGYPVTYSKADLIADFNKAGFTTDADGLYKHFQKYGVKENVSPNKYFDPDYYFQSKAADYYDVDVTQVTDIQVAAMKSAFAKAGLSAWDHYLKYGMKEGIDPNANFNTSKYMLDKLALMQETDPTYTLDDLVTAFKNVNLNPVMHYLSYGIGEGLTAKVATVHGGVAQALTYDTDNLVGTTSIDDDGHNIDDDGNLVPDDTYNDYFTAEVGTLQSVDTVDGLGGNDTLYVRVSAGNGSVNSGSLEPTIKNVETILFRSQMGDGNNVQTAAPVSAYIDADRISLANGTNLTIGSDNSRADLAIEDVRHYSNETTVRFADADPAVNFQLYFDPQHLKAASATSTGELILKLMDVKSAQESGGEQPLLTSPYNGFKFIYNGSEEITLTFRESDKDLYTGESANYGKLLTAVEHAIADYEATSGAHVGVFTVAAGTGFTSTATVDDISYTGNGTTLVLKSSNGSVKEKGWTLTGNEAPASNRYVAEISNTGTESCPLIQTNVELDNVGRVQWDDAYTNCLPDDIIKGSNAGDLQIGSMSMRSGIERMDLYVDRGSWLSGLYSTNNTLRMVTVTAADINGDTIKGNVGDQRSQDAQMADDVKNGQLYIGAWEGKLDDQGNGKNNLTWADPAKLLSAHYNDGSDDAIAGLHDVAVFDAAKSGYTGDINIAAEITKDSYDKYLKSVDGVKGLDKLAPVGGYGKAFTYATGSGNDVVNMTVNGDIAADVDFAMNIDTGAGNDLVAFRYDSEITTAQSVDNKYMQKVQINTQEGNDNVWFYGGQIGLVEHTGHETKYAETTPGDDWTLVLDGNNEPEKDAAGRYLWERDVTYSAYEPVNYGGAVEINAGSGADTIYANQIDMMTGGAGSGVTWGPDNYNAVFVMNASEGLREIGVDSLYGATLNNDIQTGAKTFTITAGDTAKAMYVTVNFKGFTSAYKVADLTVKDGSAKVSAEDINHAVMNAISTDAVLNGLLSAKDGSGYSLIIESLINGKMATTDLSLSFDVRDTAGDVIGTATPTANGSSAWYSTQYGVANNANYDGAAATDVDGNRVEHNVSSQVVVNGGTNNDLIVLGKNGVIPKDGVTTVTFKDTTNGTDVDPKTVVEGNTMTVTVDGETYTSTYEDGKWTAFQTKPDIEGEEPKDLEKDAGWKYNDDLAAKTELTGYTYSKDLNNDVKTPTSANDKVQIKFVVGEKELLYEAKGVATADPAVFEWSDLETTDEVPTGFSVDENINDGVVSAAYELQGDTDKTEVSVKIGVATVGTKTQDLKADFEDDEQTSAVASFTKVDENAEPIDGTGATAPTITLGGGTTALTAGDVFANKYTITTAAFENGSQGDDVIKVTVTYNDGAVKTADINVTWDATNTKWVADPGTDPVTASYDDTTKVLTITVNNGAEALKALPTATATTTSQSAVPAINNPTAADADATASAETITLTDIAPEENDEVTITVTPEGGEAKVYKAVVDATGQLGGFKAEDETPYNDVTGELTEDPDGSGKFVLTLTAADGGATLKTVSKPTYVEAPTATPGDPDPDGGVAEVYANTGRDIIQLDANFGNDAIVDFDSGTDQIDVSGLGLTKPVQGAINSLDDNEVAFATGTPKAATGIYTQDEVTKLWTDGAIKFTGTKGTALAFLDDGSVDPDNVVYTVAQVTTAGATVMGSLTLANGESIVATDLVGVSNLLEDPAYEATA